MSEGKNIEMGGLKLYHQGFQGHQLERFPRVYLLLLQYPHDKLERLRA